MKYYYQQGRCEASNYLSLNPVQYDATEENDTYKKSKMACHMVLDGKCDKTTTCQTFIDAPELMKYDRINLRDRKLDG